MKIKQLIVVFLLATTYYSCSKDDSTSPPSNLSFDLIGNWALTDYHFNGTQRTLSDINVSVISFSATAWDIGVSSIFIESPNDYSNIGGYNLDVTVIDENGTEYYLPSHRQVNEVGTWAQTNNFLGITIDEEIRQAAISELSATTLKYSINGSESFYDENNDLITILRTDYYTFTRDGSN
jgi:hypothetical protein